ncbi:uncharacterized protein LOC129597011 [Paramacrobiotus metropolitanus]|uniref:uncharacterized protein LOC129597011 n=1 Tax=Paramacrobiotus metropolitanus TaxID=2943436 RepID=UPI002445BD75|nr:uncharacterized protein LOC129597011 [Paramacrobiotus metropolitanus]
MALDWKLLLVITSMALVMRCPSGTRGCPRPPSSRPWLLEPYNSRAGHCSWMYYAPTPQYRNHYQITLWRKSPHYHEQLLCLINALTDDRLPLSKKVDFITEGNPVRLSCHPLENVHRNIHIMPDHFTGFYDHGTGLYFWTKDSRHFCEKWERTHKDYKCHGAVDRNAPDGELWIKSFTAADEGDYACAFIEKCEIEGWWCSLRVGLAYRLRVAPKKTAVPARTTPGATKSYPPTTQKQIQPVSSASFITPPTALLPTQWFSTDTTKGEQASSATQTTAGLMGNTTSSDTTAFWTTAISDVSAAEIIDSKDLYSSLGETPTVFQLPASRNAIVTASIASATSPSPSTAQLVGNVTSTVYMATATGPATSRDTSSAPISIVSADDESRNSSADGIFHPLDENNSSISETVSVGTPLSTVASSTVTEEENVSTETVNDTEEVTEFDWVPSDQRRHTMYPSECPACTGNCPCPPSKRKRKHL